MATAADAEIVMKLYELRREATMREARRFVAFDFQPKTIADLQAVTGNRGSQENAYWRQVMSYWDMAAALVLRGAVDPELFFDWNGEGLFLRAKFRRFHEEYRRATGMEFMRKTGECVERFPVARETYDRMVKLQEAREAKG